MDSATVAQGKLANSPGFYFILHKMPKMEKYAQKMCILCLFVVLIPYVNLCFATEDGSQTKLLLNLSCKDADIRDVLRGIAMQHGVNIVPDSDALRTHMHLLRSAVQMGFLDKREQPPVKELIVLI